MIVNKNYRPTHLIHSGKIVITENIIYGIFRDGQNLRGQKTLNKIYQTYKYMQAIHILE